MNNSENTLEEAINEFNNLMKSLSPSVSPQAAALLNSLLRDRERIFFFCLPKSFYEVINFEIAKCPFPGLDHFNIIKNEYLIALDKIEIHLAKTDFTLAQQKRIFKKTSEYSVSLYERARMTFSYSRKRKSEKYDVALAYLKSWINIRKFIKNMPKTSLKELQKKQIEKESDHEFSYQKIPCGNYTSAMSGKDILRQLREQ